MQEFYRGCGGVDKGGIVRSAGQPRQGRAWGGCARRPERRRRRMAAGESRADNRAFDGLIAASTASSMRARGFINASRRYENVMSACHFICQAYLTSGRPRFRGSTAGDRDGGCHRRGNRRPAAAIDLARCGFRVVVLGARRACRRQDALHAVRAGERSTPVRPSLTMKRVFEELFADAGVRLEDRLTLRRWRSWRDMHGGTDRGSTCSRMRGARKTRSASFAGGGGARLPPLQRTRPTHLRARSNIPSSTRRGRARSNSSGAARRMRSAIFGINPFGTLWDDLAHYFSDVRLRRFSDAMRPIAARRRFWAGDPDADRSCRAGRRGASKAACIASPTRCNAWRPRRASASGSARMSGKST